MKKQNIMAILLAAGVLAGSSISVGAEAESILPYTGEEVTFSFFWFDTGNDYTKTDLPIVKALQEKLGNVKLEVELLPMEDYFTKIPLLCASGEIPDIMIVNAPYEILPTYGQNDIFMDYGAYAEYMPNVAGYAAELKMLETLKDDSGRLLALPINIMREDDIRETWVANQTLLDELGIAIPQTQEEFLEACRKVKAEKGITPLSIRYDLTYAIESCFNLMYQTDGDSGMAYYPKEGKWDFGPLRENSEFKEMLTFMNTLWEEELISHEINTMTDEQFLDNIYNGEFAFTFMNLVNFGKSRTDATVAFKDAYDFEVTAIPTPKGTASRLNVTTTADGSAGWSVVSNANTEHPELLAACIDLMYSEEVSILKDYGIEGVSYEVAEDGTLKYTDDVKVASNYFAGETALLDLGYWNTPWLRAFGVSGPTETQLINWSPEQIEEMKGILAKLDSGEMEARYNYALPTMSVDENTEYSDCMAAVETYLDECIAKFIMGDMDLEADWDEFMTKLAGYGDVARACEILNSKEMIAFTGNWR